MMKWYHIVVVQFDCGSLLAIVGAADETCMSDRWIREEIAKWRKKTGVMTAGRITHHYQLY